MRISWKNQQGSRDRQAIAIIVLTDGSPHRFIGKNIEGVCHSSLKRHEKNGKWSYDEFEVLVPDDAKLIAFHQDWDTGQTWPQTCWGDAYEWLRKQAPQLDMDAFEEFMKKEFPKTAARFDEQEKAEEQFGGQPPESGH